MSGLEPMSSAISSSSADVTSKRTRDPAYDNPNVRATIRGLRDKLREASKQTGDIDKDILQLVIQPWMSKEPVFAPFRNGGVVKGGRTYPSSHYGWLQQMFTKYFVRYVVNENAAKMLSEDRYKKYVAARDKGDALKKAKGAPLVGLDGQSKRILGNALRAWWVQNRNTMLPLLNSKIEPFKGTPLYTEMLKYAAAAFQAKETVPMYIATHRGH